MQEKDVSGKVIFDDPLLCSQFLRDNFDIPFLRNVQPEDIEDVTAKYQTFLGSEYKADMVKKIRMRTADLQKETKQSLSVQDEIMQQANDIYLVSLVEHKSTVDYDVAMQLLKYMICIWTQYAKDMEELQKNITRRKDFRYPPILPIVYYEGREKWTAEMNFQDRILLKEVFGRHMPDFTYQLVRIHDYSNAELLSRADEMSIIMLINKIQTADDFSRFFEDEKDMIEKVLQKAPESVIAILADTVASLCRRLKATPGETEQCVEKVRKRQMGYLFENMEELDIQAERRNTAEAREKAEEARKKAAEARKKAEEVQKALEEAQQQIQQQEREKQRLIVRVHLRNGGTGDAAIQDLMKECGLSADEAKKITDECWEQKDS